MGRRPRRQRRPWGEAEGSGPRPELPPQVQLLSHQLQLQRRSQAARRRAGGRRHLAPDGPPQRGHQNGGEPRHLRRADGERGVPRRWDPAPRPQPPPPPPPRPRGEHGAPATAPDAIDAFDLFCAYHLGITADGGYRIQNIHEVAKRFGTNAASLKQTLQALGMDADDIVHSGFDLAAAQVDIMVAPPGISRRELARPLFEEFQQSPRRTRNWAREMEDAAREIEKTIEREGRWSPSPRTPNGKLS